MYERPYELVGAADSLTARVRARGNDVLRNPMLNRGTAFTRAEREALGLEGLLPSAVSSMDGQVRRTEQQYRGQPDPLAKHVYLASLRDRNEVLFYRLMGGHIAEMMPLIYTPTVGEACQHFSRIYRRPRGLFLAYEHRDRLAELLECRPYRDVDVVVVTDGERILGLGDLGIGGMGIPVGKLSLYTLCGGVDPARTLPVFLDVGTDNPEALADPLYLGTRHPRVRGRDYDDFIEAFVAAVERTLPGVLLQWEDFAQENARRLLERYRDRLCTFNDDIQGTAAVALAAVLGAGRVTGTPLAEQRVVILGGGSAGTGIADALAAALVAGGLPAREARDRIWLVGRRGLIHAGTPGLKPAQRPYARPIEEPAGWGDGGGEPGLRAVVEHARPTVLIGTTGQPGQFAEDAVRALARHVARPAIFPLSNPTSRSEATPADLLAWTDGRALVATGSPFDPVSLGGRTHRVAQCNNAYIFPGLGQGVVASGARRVSDAMFLAAARAVADAGAGGDAEGLLPPLEEIVRVSRRVALAVALAARAEGLAGPWGPEELEARIAARWWEPRYRRLRRRR